MKAVVLFLASSILVVSQGQTLLPDAEFDLNAGLKQPAGNRHNKNYFVAGPGGLVLLTI